jgi:uncharacterized LabA/DUF88 family protein
LSIKRVICYIDGFNLYHSIDNLGPSFSYLKWLDLWSLSSAFIKPSQEQITDVYYFTALAHWLTGPNKRHKEYIKAVSHFGVKPILGHFKKKPGNCKACGATWTTHEEKQSDVNIAAYLIHHAHLDLFDKALVLSADSDLCQALQLIIDTRKDKEINILVPPNRYEITRELRGMVGSHKIKQKHLKNNLLPDTIRNKKTGDIIVKKPNKYLR